MKRLLKEEKDKNIKILEKLLIQKVIIETKNSEITNKAIKIKNLQKEFKNHKQSKAKKSEKKSQYTDKAVQVRREQSKKKHQKSNQTDKVASKTLLIGNNS